MQILHKFQQYYIALRHSSNVFAILFMSYRRVSFSESKTIREEKCQRFRMLFQFAQLQKERDRETRINGDRDGSSQWALKFESLICLVIICPKQQRLWLGIKLQRVEKGISTQTCTSGGCWTWTRQWIYDIVMHETVLKSCHGHLFVWVKF